MPRSQRWVSPAHVYRNLHKKCYSIRKHGRVIAHEQHLFIEDAVFVVQPAGRAKVLREKRKNVHAYIKGDVTAGEPGSPIPIAGRAIRYNPYLMDCFFYADTKEPVYQADRVLLTRTGAFVV